MGKDSGETVPLRPADTSDPWSSFAEYVHDAAIPNSISGEGDSDETVL